MQERCEQARQLLIDIAEPVIVTIIYFKSVSWSSRDSAKNLENVGVSMDKTLMTIRRTSALTINQAIKMTLQKYSIKSPKRLKM